MPDKLLTYEQFRTGLTYADVYHMIWNRPHKRRNGVLGYWRELKQKMYADYLERATAEIPENFQLSDLPIPECQL